MFCNRTQLSMLLFVSLAFFASAASGISPAFAADSNKPTKLLLLMQGPDGHPPGTHEYRAGQRLIKKLLSTTDDLEVALVEAGADWPADPTALDDVDGVVLFVSEGAKWMDSDNRRKELFARFAERGGGLVAYHWAIGTRTSEPIDGFVKLLGACHGGPDRAYKVLETTLSPTDSEHPITRHIKPVRVKEEFYYKLKHQQNEGLTWLMEAEIEGDAQPVAWAWDRPDGGRSFGFSGLHFHQNWSEPAYQRLMARGVLWTLKRTPPKKDFPAELTADDLKLP